MAEKYFDDALNAWVIREGDHVRYANTSDLYYSDTIYAAFKQNSGLASKILSGTAGATLKVTDKITGKLLDEEEREALGAQREAAASKKTMLEMAAGLTGSSVMQNLAAADKMTREGNRALFAMGKHFVKKLGGKKAEG